MPKPDLSKVILELRDYVNETEFPLFQPQDFKANSWAHQLTERLRVHYLDTKVFRNTFSLKYENEEEIVLRALGIVRIIENDEVDIYSTRVSYRLSGRKNFTYYEPKTGEFKFIGEITTQLVRKIEFTNWYLENIV